MKVIRPLGTSVGDMFNEMAHEIQSWSITQWVAIIASWVIIMMILLAQVK